MPRKNARPAAKKAAAKRKAQIEAKTAPQRRVGIIAHPHTAGSTLALLAAAGVRRFDQSS